MKFSEVTGFKEGPSCIRIYDNDQDPGLQYSRDPAFLKHNI
jgi:hypothetical protein